MRYQVAGEGEPVILVHGLSGSSSWWTKNISALAERHRVYLIDLPGFGAMSRLRPRFVLSKASSWLLAWIEAVGLNQAHMVGHSMGGYICLRLASHKPAVVNRLVLVAPAGVPLARSLLGNVVALFVSIRSMAPRFLPLLIRDALRADPVVLWLAARDLLAEDVREQIESIVASTLLIWGENDPLIPPATGYFLRKEIANSRLLILKNAGHIPMFDRPQEFNAAVLAFLAGEPVGE